MAHKILSWGKCKAVVTPLSGYGVSDENEDGIQTAITFKSIVQNSTSLETAEGEKTEARIEGGGLEAMLQGEDTYTLTFQERIGSEDQVRLINRNGVVDGIFQIDIIPANRAAKKLTVCHASAHVALSYSSADGIIATYTFTSLDSDDDEDEVSDQQILVSAQ